MGSDPIFGPGPNCRTGSRKAMSHGCNRPGDSMDFELKDLLEAIGPNATLIFAAWIFLSVLQTRYTGAYDRYRALIEGYRNSSGDSARRRSLVQQIDLYKRRC